MKNVLMLLVGILSFQISLSQSNISTTDKLASTAKVWGFLKYYHPEVADGKYDWDQELFSILDRLDNVENNEQLSDLYLNWIDQLGEVKKCKKCDRSTKSEYFGKNFDLDWINSDLFSTELQEKLKWIEHNRHQGSKHYVSIAYKTVGNIKVENETLYPDFDWSDKNMRLLSLFRYWNVVEYFFPYKYQMDVDWDQTLTNLIPKFVSPKTQTDYHLALNEMIIAIDDSHAAFFSDLVFEHFGIYYFPAKIKYVEGTPVVSGFYNAYTSKKSPLEIGDVILKIDTERVSDIFDRISKHVNGSNLSKKRANSNYRVFNGHTDNVNVTVLRNNQEKEFVVPRYTREKLKRDTTIVEEKFKVLSGNIGYVNMGLLAKEDIPSMKEKLGQTDAIIFDIRNYPKGTLYPLAHYLSSKRKAFYKAIVPDLNYPGKFTIKEPGRCGTNRKAAYNGKVILMVNYSTQSHAEFTTMCLQTADNVVTIGNQTSGADGNVTRLELVNGSKTMITGIGIFYPDGTKTQRTGIKIDHVVKPTVNGIKEGKDEMLEKAIELAGESN